MIGADADNLKRFITWANNQRAAQLPNGVDIRSITAIVGQDIEPVTLHWDTGIVDQNGTTLPPDWRVSIAQ